MSHSGPVIPAFVDLSEAEQAAELLAFLKGLGAEVSGKSSKVADPTPSHPIRLLCRCLSIFRFFPPLSFAEEYKQEDGLPGNVHSIVEASTQAWTAPVESDAEAALNSLISLILMMPPDRVSSLHVYIVYSCIL